MSIDIKAVKRKLLVKYPTFGSTIASLDFKPEPRIPTAETDGSEVLYNPEFVEKYSVDEQVFLFAHEVCHVVLDHIYRSEGKDPEIWNIATDSVINANLRKDGLKVIEGTVDIPGAENYDAETMYEKLIREKQGQQEQQSQNDQDQQSQPNQQEGQGQTRGSHEIWKKAIEDRKKAQEQGEQSGDGQPQESTDSVKKGQNGQSGQGQQDQQSQSDQDQQGQSKKVSEKEIFEQNRKERKKQLEEMSKKLASEASQQAGTQASTGLRNVSNIGTSKPLIDWRKLLRQAVKYNEEYTRKNSRMRNGYFTHRLEQIPMPESEIVLDVSGSVNEVLLKNFLRECKNILENSKVKVGCFDTRFYGFQEIRKMEDIDKLSFPGGGGTDFDVAVGAFSRRASNKIIFTDGYANMPKETVRDVIWIVFGDRKIKPKGGRVINITGEQLRRLYQYYSLDER